ncbi:MAG: hypothetical protein HQK96_18630, partial [Nitrospirae bacterium]|nr:hypothetical protein [Nitrospirota bacterium]
GLPLCKMRDSLLDIYNECSSVDWDGYGACAITEDSFEEAQRIIDALPFSIPTPEIVAEPTGDIGFEWYRGKGQVFVMSVSGEQRITYAGLFAGNEVHGSEHFDGVLSSTIIQNLMRLYS